MFKIRLFFASAAMAAGAMTTFVTVAPQPANAGTLACAQRPDMPVLA
jgi:3-deoxy-D-arabino-heptulosonate 7-phosphate (DAHP) synthase